MIFFGLGLEWTVDSLDFCAFLAVFVLCCSASTIYCLYIIISYDLRIRLFSEALVEEQFISAVILPRHQAASHPEHHRPT